jgi:hypothetical protein
MSSSGQLPPPLTLVARAIRVLTPSGCGGTDRRFGGRERAVLGHRRRRGGQQAQRAHQGGWLLSRGSPPSLAVADTGGGSGGRLCAGWSTTRPRWRCSRAPQTAPPNSGRRLLNETFLQSCIPHAPCTLSCILASSSCNKPVPTTPYSPGGGTTAHSVLTPPTTRCPPPHIVQEEVLQHTVY